MSNKEIAKLYANKAYNMLNKNGIWASVLDNAPANQKKMIIRQYEKVFGKENVKWDRETNHVTCTRV
tara:strand:- start:3746 stop:3946 length:201 start_codon:yes stop_codon:yes gene_type:complete